MRAGSPDFFQHARDLNEPASQTRSSSAFRFESGRADFRRKAHEARRFPWELRTPGTPTGAGAFSSNIGFIRHNYRIAPPFDAAST